MYENLRCVNFCPMSVVLGIGRVDFSKYGSSALSGLPLLRPRLIRVTDFDHSFYNKVRVELVLPNGVELEDLMRIKGFGGSAVMCRLLFEAIVGSNNNVRMEANCPVLNSYLTINMEKYCTHG